MVPAPGSLDSNLKEFWVSNPWQIVAEGYNLSAFERNRTYLNLRGTEFVEISHLTGGADSDGDGRAVVAADFRNSGKMDLVVRQAGGGPLFYFENRFPDRNWLTVSLQGTGGNVAGIGAKLVAEVAGRTVVREMYPHNGYFSQAPNRVHFGLGDAAKVDRLRIRWPDGTEQEWKDVAGNRHIMATQGGSALETAPVRR
jgi:hypothetical protein